MLSSGFLQRRVCLSLSLSRMNFIVNCFEKQNKAGCKGQVWSLYVLENLFLASVCSVGLCINYMDAMDRSVRNVIIVT